MSSSLRTPELAAIICERLSTGRESLREICRDPLLDCTEAAIRRWALEDEAFGAQYTRARQLGYLAMADDIQDIADDGTNDFVERETQRGGVEVVADHEHINRSRLRVDTRKWMLSKMLPKVFGDKIAVEHSGSVGIEDRLRAGRARVAGSE